LKLINAVISVFNRNVMAITTKRKFLYLGDDVQVVRLLCFEVQNPIKVKVGLGQIGCYRSWNSGARGSWFGW